MSQAVTSLQPHSFGLNEALPSIFSYHDYRQYLKDVYAYRRKLDPTYNLVKFAKALGFSSHSGLAMILTGKRELRSPYIDKLVKHLKLSIRQQLYLEAMIRAVPLSAQKRRVLLQEIDQQAGMWEPPALQDGIRLIDFFIVQQVLALYRGFVPLQTIQKHFRYRIQQKDLIAVLQWMHNKQYIESSPLGFRIQQSILTLQDETPNASGKQFHKDCLSLAATALESDSIEKREFQTYLFTLDSSRIPQLKSHIKKLVLEAISEYECELEGDTVLQLHFNLFEITNRLTTGLERTQ